MTTMTILRRTNNRSRRAQQTHKYLHNRRSSQLLTAARQIQINNLGFTRRNIRLTYEGALVPKFRNLVRNSHRAINIPTNLNKRVRALNPRRAIRFNIPRTFRALLIRLIRHVPLVRRRRSHATHVRNYKRSLRVLVKCQLQDVGRSRHRFATLSNNLHTREKVVFHTYRLILTSLSTNHISRRPILTVSISSFISKITHDTNRVISRNAFFTHRLVRREQLTRIQTTRRDRTTRTKEHRMTKDLLNLLRLIRHSIRRITRSPTIRNKGQM